MEYQYPQFRVIACTMNGISSYDCPDLQSGINLMNDLYRDWMAVMEKYPASDWNEMIENCWAFVETCEEEDDCYDTVYELTKEELESIGWKLKEE